MGVPWGVKYPEIAKCDLFPSETQRDWSKFKVPVKRFDFKKFKPFDRILVRDNLDCEWTIDLFSNMGINNGCVIGMRGYPFRMAIPYNEKTSRLINTKLECPEFYKWWAK